MLFFVKRVNIVLRSQHIVICHRLITGTVTGYKLNMIVVFRLCTES
jgi:hypothetical protein